MLEELAEDGARFVPLAEALGDPLYAREDHYVGGTGRSWLYRVAPGLDDAWAWDAAQLHALQVRFAGRVERPRFDLDAGLTLERTDAARWSASSGSGEGRVERGADGHVTIPSSGLEAADRRALGDWAEARFGRDAPVRQ